MIRIMSNPSYGSNYDRPEQLANYLDMLKKRYANYDFWSDDLSFTENNIIDLSCVMSWKHLTDAYLLGLAYKNKGKLATLDRGINTNWLVDKKADVVEFL